MPGFVKLLALLLIFSVIEASILQKYCNVKCQGSTREHTMCIYPESEIHAKSCGKVIKSGVDQKEIDLILNLHNSLRQNVAKGNETRGLYQKQPSAKFMENLVWDQELAEIAQRWANQCKRQRDKCRDTESYVVGQNVGCAVTKRGENSTNAFTNKLIKFLCNYWFEQVNNYDSTKLANFTSEVDEKGHFTGHYTQMVWANTTKIGCGLVLSHFDKETTLHLVCYYAPTGNVFGKSVYDATCCSDIMFEHWT